MAGPPAPTAQIPVGVGRVRFPAPHPRMGLARFLQHGPRIVAPASHARGPSGATRTHLAVGTVGLSGTPLAPIVMLATGRSGLGHLRRVTNIAMAMPPTAPPLILLANAGLAGLEDAETERFAQAELVERHQMSARARALGAGLVVVDTAVVPELAAIAAPLALILRESPAGELARFRLAGRREWDLVLVPNPPDWWRPSPAAVGARRVEAVGWIYRPAPQRSATGGPPRVLVASGGGGTVETATRFGETVDLFIADLRRRMGMAVEIVQAIGPRAPQAGRLASADRTVDPGARLHDWFAAADLVVTTAGYNSTLELALLDVPVLFVPIGRTYDDQAERARRWAPALGGLLDPGDLATSVDWAASVLMARRRRPPAPLGPSGAAAAARLLLDLVR